MKGMTRRRFLASFAALVAGSALAGCVSKEPTAGPTPTRGVKAGSTAEPTAPPAAEMKGNLYLKSFPLVKEKETLRFFTPDLTWLLGDYSTKPFTVTYEEKTNVHIEWDLIPQSGLQEKKQLAFASGELPDCFLAAGITPNEQVQYGSQGLLIPVEDLIAQYNPECQKIFTETPEGELGKKMLTAPDGHIYSYPNYSYCYHAQYLWKLWINQKWLDKVSMKMPATTDETHEVLVAFRDKDANGSGKKDAIPLSGAASWAQQSTYWLMNAFVPFDSDRGYLYVLDKKVYLGADKPEYKEGLKYAAKLYADGLIDPDIFTQDSEGLRRKVLHEGYALVGSLGAPWPMGFAEVDYTGKPDQRSSQYVVLPPLKGPAGAQWCVYNPYVVGSGSYVITSACKHPELAARWVDWVYTEEGLLLHKYGREGQEWYRPTKGEMGHGEGLGPIPARFAWMPGLRWASEQQLRAAFGTVFPAYEKREFRGAWAVDPEAPLEVDLIKATKPYEGHGMKEVWPSPMLTAQEADEIRQLMTQVNDYVTEMHARFVTGELKVDAEWDKYVGELKAMGLERYLEICQGAYDRFLSA